MATYPYTQSPGNIGKLFAQIQSSGKPSKVSTQWLALIGLKSSNDRRLVSLLKFIGFTDDASVPKDEVWLAYKHRDKAADVLGAAIKAGYADLFHVYPDADRKDDEALRNFFSSKTGLASDVVGLIVRTFKAMVELARFDHEDGELAGEVAKIDLPKPKPAASENNGTHVGEEQALSVTVNIQLQIAATDDASVYDKFFESLYKHVLSRDKH